MFMCKKVAKRELQIFKWCIGLWESTLLRNLVHTEGIL